MYFLLIVAILQAIAGGQKWGEGSKMLGVLLVMYAATNCVMALMESN